MTAPKDATYRRLVVVGSPLLVERAQRMVEQLAREMGGRYMVATFPAERMRA